MATLQELKPSRVAWPRSRQVAALFYASRVELVSLAAALGLTAILARGVLHGMERWDANGVVMLIGALWMAICVFLYRLLERTAR